MAEMITAVYENGLLRPTTPLKLQEHQSVRLQILPEEPAGEAERLLGRLIADGLMTPPPGHSDVEPVSEKERREIAETIGQAPGKLLSEIIIEERGE